MRRFRFYLFGILVILLALQLIRPEKNIGIIDDQIDFIQVSQVPDTLARVFLNSCYDCHSDETRYPWYGNIAPLSWFMNNHITQGKEHLNFSKWGLLEKSQKISRLDDICNECSEEAMPLKSYLMIHRKAALKPEEIEAICNWTETETIEIMGSGK